MLSIQDGADVAGFMGFRVSSSSPLCLVGNYEKLRSFQSSQLMTRGLLCGFIDVCLWSWLKTKLKFGRMIDWHFFIGI